MKFNIRLIYLYLFSFVGLLVFVIGCVRLVDLGLKVIVFNNADIYVSYPMMKDVSDPRSSKQYALENEAQQKMQREESKRNRQREISSSLAMILVGAPLYLYHWSLIQKSAHS